MSSWALRSTVTLRLPPALFTCLVLVVLAGCSGFAGQETPTRDTYGVPSTTDVGSDESPRTATAIRPEDELLPGVTADGIERPDRLLAEHRRVVRDAGVEFHEHLVARHPNGSVYARLERRLWAAPDGSHYYRSFHLVGGATPGESRRETYQNETDRFELRVDDETSYDHDSVRDPDVDWDRMNLERVRRFLVAADSEQTTVTRIFPVGGPALYRIRTTVDEVLGLRPSPAFSSVEMTVFVDRRGMIHQMDLNYTATFGKRIYRVDRTLRFETGTVTVPRPDWVDEARRSTDPDGQPTSIATPTPTTTPTSTPTASSTTTTVENASSTTSD